MMLAAMLFGAALAAAQPMAAAQAPPTPPAEQPQDPDTVEGVVVEGRRKLSEEEQRKAESAFVRELAAPTRRDRLARWDGELCIGVVGLPQVQGSYVSDRIAEEAAALGLRPGPPGCKADVFILFTSQADKTAADFRAKRRAFFTGGAGGSGLLESGGGGQRMKGFLTTPRPVRWWHVSRLSSSDGRPLAAIEIPPGSGRYVPANATTGSSRLASLLKEDLARALVIVDSTRMRGVTYEALASYLSMVTLAQLDPEAEPRDLRTIMTLFADRDAGRRPADTLTDWDRAYLKGLYEAPDNARNLNAQRGAIRRSLGKVGVQTQP